jgi:pseudomonalisin
MKRATLWWKIALTLALLGLETSAGQGADRILLAGNHPIAAESLVSQGNADANLPLTMTIRFALRNAAELATLLKAQQDPVSPTYHKWLKTGEFNDRFGPTPSDVKMVADWLTNEGFSVESSGDSYIQFGGNVSQAQQSFAVRIARYGDGAKYANVEDPAIPSQFAAVIGAITGLDNLTRIRPAGLHRIAPSATDQAKLETLALNESVNAAETLASPDGPPSTPLFSFENITAFGPQDMRTFYDETVHAGSDGAGSCIALIGVSQIAAGALNAFDAKFHLPPIKLTTVVSGSNPGFTKDGSEIEAELDVEWSHALAPGAAEKLFVASEAKGDALATDIGAAVNDNTCGAISISFSYCGAPSSQFTGVLNPLFQQAAAQGQSVFVSSGDEGAADLDDQCNPTGARGVNEMSADPFVTSVGGTQTSPQYDQHGNVVGYAQEDGWNSDGATGGGASQVFAKPSYQSAPGVPADDARDVPDIALIASPVSPGVFLGDAVAAKPAQVVCCIGGTSLSAPMMAGFVTVLDQQVSERLGAINPILYDLGTQQYGAAGTQVGFHDITSGYNGYDGVSGFYAGAGYDQVTGLGSIDFDVFAQAVKGDLPPVVTTITATPSLLDFGDVDATGAGKPHKIVFANKGFEIASLGAVSLPSDFTMVPGGDHCSGTTIVPKKSCFVTVQFAPSGQGPCSQTLSIPYNGGASSPVTVALSGTATAVSLNAPTAVSFAPVAAGSSSKPKSVSITNSSVSATVTMSSAALTAPFTIARDSCSGATLGPKKHCVISIDFAPPGDTPSQTSMPGNLSFTFSYGVNGGSVGSSLTGVVK